MMRATIIAAALACPGPHTPGYVHPAPSYELVHRLALLEERMRGVARWTYSSGVRCPLHNAAVGGSATSRHLDGEGVDVPLPAKWTLPVAMAALDLGFRVLVEGDHLHLDLGRPGSARLMLKVDDSWRAIGAAVSWPLDPHEIMV